MPTFIFFRFIVCELEGSQKGVFPLKCIWLLQHCLALPRRQMIFSLVQNLHLAMRFGGFASLSPLKSVNPNFIILGIMEAQLFEDELAADDRATSRCHIFPVY